MKISTKTTTIKATLQFLQIVRPVLALIESPTLKQNTVAENEFVAASLKALEFTPYTAMDSLPALTGLDLAEMQIPSIDNPFGPSGTSIAETTNSGGGENGKVTVDARTGVLSTLTMSKPILPGNGIGNNLLWSVGSMQDSDDIHGQHHDLEKISQAAVRNWFDENQSLLGINSKNELFSPGRTRTAIHGNGDMIQMSIRRTFKGIPVVGSRATATIKMGNLINIGLESWGTIPDDFGIDPKLSEDDAFEVLSEFSGRDYVRGRENCKPELQIIALATGVEEVSTDSSLSSVSSVNGVFDGLKLTDFHEADRLQLRGHRNLGKSERAGSNHDDVDNKFENIGDGYTYSLVWKICPIFFGQAQEIMEGYVDAHTSKIYSFIDKVDYFNAKGSVYPISNDGQGADGTLQQDWPMPYMTVGSELTTTGGNYNQAGNVTAKLSGEYVEMRDFCNSQNVAEVTQTDGINWGGNAARASSNADCEVPGFGDDSNTHASRTGFYELNKMKEIARSRLPKNNWLKGQLVAKMNRENSCNAYWNGSTVNFYREGSGCGNTGEIAAVFDHEWGHGMDANDVNGGIAFPSGEGIADLYSALRLNDSCIGRGFYNDGRKCATGGECKICTGVRDIDQAEKKNGGPWTHTMSNNKCGSSVHCIGVVYSEAVWDLYKRKLQQGQFNYDENTALEIVTRLTYIAAGNINTWFTGPPTFSGCGSQSGYRAYLEADDDDGDLTNGTPHMSAIFEAFNDHEIACPTYQIPVFDSGCPNNPQTQPEITATPVNMGVQLSWTTVSNSVEYEVLRSEGVMQCSQGKVLLGKTTGNTFEDSGLQNGREYYYIVVPKGVNDACYGPSSDCAAVVPSAQPYFTVDCSDSSVIDFDVNRVPASVSRQCVVTPYDGWTGSISVECNPTSTLMGIQCEGESVFIKAGQSTATCTITISIVSGAEMSEGSVTMVARGRSIERTSSFDVTITKGGGPQQAIFEGGSPICKKHGSSCDSVSLLDGRGLNLGPEPNQPNIRGNDCIDGSSGTYHEDESLDKIFVRSLDDKDMTEGSLIEVTATVWAWNYGDTDSADFYYTSDALNPEWLYIGTVPAGGGGARELKVQYILPEGELQAVRINFRYKGSVSVCSGGNYDEADELAFTVVTKTPTRSTSSHSSAPSLYPSYTPTLRPSLKPSTLPSNLPSNAPSEFPSLSSSAKPSQTPSVTPSLQSSSSPSIFTSPSLSPSQSPSAPPTTTPSTNPSYLPTFTSFFTPSISPSSQSSLLPSWAPSIIETMVNGGPQTAIFDNNIGAPRCFDVGVECNPGTLMEGRASLGPELSSPNTIDGCRDGTVGKYLRDESIERVVVRAGDVESTEEMNLTEGMRATITATVYAWSSGQDDRADFFYASNAANPTWEFLGTLIPPSGGLQELKMAYTLPPGSLQAVRVGFRYKGSLNACSPGNYNDRDDLVFSVASGTSAPTSAPTPSNHDAIYDSGLGIPICAQFGNSCDSLSLLNSRGESIGISEENAPNTLDSCKDGASGTYHSDESIDRIVVKSGEIDGTGSDAALTSHRRATIIASVFAFGTGTNDYADFYYTNNLENPSWTYIDTVSPAGGGVQELKVSYDLPQGKRQAVRVNFRYRGSISPCSGGNYDDHDDLAFTVSPGI
eukprot:CAMPEP_0171330948 /NCGR_PEP_ID=MMETSP0878-20121228/2361_1 /TAXON_ID=67004 /ORGANISM="Thalassiosira weissflogii, Strain CCMP1336" /LENGTH=1637 /DNA_ID=CAMNT_0011831367 /DNA_START=195 /DNA_END=5108 /DNA_ORIENTATION=+